jgi:trehalose/maltose hydrolase-like predicted phosphorylase
MLFFLFSDREVRRIFERLGYDYSDETARKTIDYYEPRTSHGSTLSLIAHARLLARIAPESSWQRFLVALETDIGDIQGGTTREGIHMGVMSGTLDLLQRAYLGADIRDEGLHFEPRLVDRLDGLSLSMLFRGTPIRVTLEGHELTVAALADGFSPPIRVSVGEQVAELAMGESCTFAVAAGAGGR